MLDLQQLVKTYAGGVTALHGITMQVPRGMFGLLGPNGSGKTTLMRILAGLLEPTSGRVTFDGDDIVQHPENIWPRLGYLPQYFGFYPGLSGTDMLKHMLQLKGVGYDAGLNVLCAELLARVNLTEAADRKVKSYSGGMRQRLGIAQAIAGNPELLIVDEPTAGLDPEERTRFYGLLAELAETRTVLLSTHIVDDVAVLCPNFAVIRNGRLLATTTPRDAKASIGGTMYEGELGRGELEALSTHFAITQSYLVEGRHRVRVHAPSHEVPAGFEGVPPTLEDAYMLLTLRDAREQSELAGAA